MQKYKSNKNIRIVSDKELREMLSKLSPSKTAILRENSYLPADELEELSDVLDNAVWEAMRDFNPSNEKGASEKTWCATCMRWAVSKYMTENHNAMSISKDDYAIRKEVARLFSENPFFTVADVANELGVTEKTVRLHMTNISRTSMNKSVGNSEDDLILEDTIADETDSDDDFPFKDLLPLLDDVMAKTLTPREMDVVKSSVGMGCEKMTSVEIAKKYGISHQMVSKIKDKALEKLRSSFMELSLSSGSMITSLANYY